MDLSLQYILYYSKYFLLVFILLWELNKWFYLYFLLFYTYTLVCVVTEKTGVKISYEKKIKYSQEYKADTLENNLWKQSGKWADKFRDFGEWVWTKMAGIIQWRGKKVKKVRICIWNNVKLQQ